MLSTSTFGMSVRKPAAEPYILLVDDHEPTLSTLRSVIESVGYPCFATISSAEAVAVSAAYRPALVVTDLSMPRLDGLGLARLIRARYSSTPIILVTGELLDPPTQNAYRRLFAAILSKPLNVPHFFCMLDALLPRPVLEPRP